MLPRPVNNFLRAVRPRANPSDQTPTLLVPAFDADVFIALRPRIVDAERLSGFGELAPEQIQARLVFLGRASSLGPAGMDRARRVVAHIASMRPAVSAVVGGRVDRAPHSAGRSELVTAPLRSESVEELRRVVLELFSQDGFHAAAFEGALAGMPLGAIAQDQAWPHQDPPMLAIALVSLALVEGWRSEAWPLLDPGSAERARAARERALAAEARVESLDRVRGGTYKVTQRKLLAYQEEERATQRATEIEVKAGARPRAGLAALPSAQARVPGLPEPAPLKPSPSWGASDAAIVAEAAKAVRAIERIAPLLRGFPKAERTLRAARAVIERGPGDGPPGYFDEDLERDRDRADARQLLALWVVRHLGGGEGWPRRIFYGRSAISDVGTLLDALRADAWKVDFSAWFPASHIEENPRLILAQPPSPEEAVAATLEIARGRHGDLLTGGRPSTMSDGLETPYEVRIWRAVQRDSARILRETESRLLNAKARLLAYARALERRGSVAGRGDSAHQSAIYEARQAIDDHALAQTFVVARSAGLLDPARAVREQMRDRSKARAAEIEAEVAALRARAETAATELVRELRKIAAWCEGDFTTRIASVPALRVSPALATPGLAAAELRRRADEIQARPYRWGGFFADVVRLANGGWADYARPRAGERGARGWSRSLVPRPDGAAYAKPLRVLVEEELLPRVRNAALRVVRLVNATEAERLVDLTEEQELLANPYSLASPGRQIDGYERRQREAYAELLKAR